MTEATLISYAGKLSREQLALVPTPQGTHKPVPHIDVVQALRCLRHLLLVTSPQFLLGKALALHFVSELEPAKPILAVTYCYLVLSTNLTNI